MLVSPLVALEVLAEMFGTAFVSAYVCREIRKLSANKDIRWWEQGFFTGWIAGGCLISTLMALGLLFGGEFALSTLCGTAPLCWFVPISFGIALYVGGPTGLLLAVNKRISSRKKVPRVLGCGKHALPDKGTAL